MQFGIRTVNNKLVVVAERLRRWTWNPLGHPRAGSNPADYVLSRKVNTFSQQYTITTTVSFFLLLSVALAL